MHAYPAAGLHPSTFVPTSQLAQGTDAAMAAAAAAAAAVVAGALPLPVPAMVPASAQGAPMGGLMPAPAGLPAALLVAQERPQGGRVGKVTKASKSKSGSRTFTSKYRGVHQTFPTRRWEAQFRCGGRAACMCVVPRRGLPGPGSAGCRALAGPSCCRLPSRAPFSPSHAPAVPLGPPTNFLCRRNGKPTSLGCFDHEEQAARAYDKMMLWCELHNAAGVKGGITNFDASGAPFYVHVLLCVFHCVALGCRGSRRPSSAVQPVSTFFPHHPTQHTPKHIPPLATRSPSAEYESAQHCCINLATTDAPPFSKHKLNLPARSPPHPQSTNPTWPSCSSAARMSWCSCCAPTGGARRPSACCARSATAPPCSTPRTRRTKTSRVELLLQAVCWRRTSGRAAGRPESKAARLLAGLTRLRPEAPAPPWLRLASLTPMTIGGAGIHLSFFHLWSPARPDDDQQALPLHPGGSSCSCACTPASPRTA